MRTYATHLSACSPPRPNPIVAQTVDILAIRDGEIDVTGLDCLPVMDIKRGR